MAPNPKNTVLQSINQPGEATCVDIFKRPDGSFGYDTFRRDPEDLTGWYSIGHLGDQRFETQSEAFEAAKKVAPWIAKD